MNENKEYLLGLLDRIHGDLTDLTEYVETYLPSVNQECADAILASLDKAEETILKWDQKVDKS